MVSICDVVTINAPLHPETEHLFDDEMIAKMKRGAYIVNTARGKICDRDAIVRALESGQLAGYAGDVWFPQPAPQDHPWRTMPHHGMTPHTSGTSLSAQARYAAGTREILECHLAGTPIRDEYLIVDGRQARRDRRSLLQRGRRHRRFGGGRAFQGLRRRRGPRRPQARILSGPFMSSPGLAGICLRSSDIRLGEGGLVPPPRLTRKAPAWVRLLVARMFGESSEAVLTARLRTRTGLIKRFHGRGWFRTSDLRACEM